jgi:hypothetical protein
VSELLCEGEEGSPDVRLLRVILRDLRLEIRPSGGKDGLPNLVLSLRRSNPNVCGIADGDFPRKPDALARDEKPHTWLPEWGALRSRVETWNPS